MSDNNTFLAIVVALCLTMLLCIKIGNTTIRRRDLIQGAASINTSISLEVK